MNRIACLWLSVSLAVSAAPAPSSPPKANPPAPSTLRWNNGETITGELVGGDASTISWKSPAFTEPLVLRWSSIRRIDHPLPPTSSEEPFAFRTKDGSLLHGDLIGLTADAVTIRSARHGEVILKREALLSAHRVHSKNIVFAGPVGDRGWTKVASEDPGVASAADASKCGGQ